MLLEKKIGRLFYGRLLDATPTFYSLAIKRSSDLDVTVRSHECSLLRNQLSIDMGRRQINRDHLRSGKVWTQGNKASIAASARVGKVYPAAIFTTATTTTSRRWLTRDYWQNKQE